MIHILNLGAGVQSTTLALMACRGDIPRFDWCIFSDTRYEPKAVYTHLKWLVPQIEQAGMRFATVTVGNLKQDALDFRRNTVSADGKRFASVPFHVSNPDGTSGLLNRQCTGEYKIKPIERFIKTDVLQIPSGKRMPVEPVVTQYFGITSDEGQRAAYPGRFKGKRKIVKDLFGEPQTVTWREWKPEKWRVSAYPFLGVELHSNRKSTPLNWLPNTMTRQDCLVWLKTHYPDREIPRSACICCPYRNNSEWRWMKQNEPEAWEDAVEFDRMIRQQERTHSVTPTGKVRKNLHGNIYVHSQRVPLDMADLSLGDTGQAGCGSLFDGQSGLCGY